MARAKRAKKASGKQLPLNRCMKTRGNRCFKLVAGKGKNGRRTLRSCTCTASTPTKASLKK